MRALTALVLPILMALPPVRPALQEVPLESLEVGQPAPDFEIPATVPIPEGGSTVGPGAVTARGGSVVLAFFPKAFTGG